MALRALLAAFFLASTAFVQAAPLAEAAEKADWPRVATLLKERTDLKSTQPDGTTALHWAAHHDDIASVQALLAAGADAKVYIAGPSALHLFHF